jgi:hypothetical protein
MTGAARERILPRVAALLLAAGLAGCGRGGDSGSGIVWRAQAGTDTLAVGDALTLEIGGRWPRTAGTVHLAWGAPGDSLLLLGVDSTRVRAAAGREGRVYRLRCLAPRPGRVQMPPVALVAASGETLALAAGPLLRVGGRIAPGAPTDLRPMAPMASLRRFPWWLAIGGALLVAAVGAALWWLRRRRRMRGAPAEPPPPPPGIEFAEAIRALLARGLPERGEMRLFTQELSWTLRRYLGRRWERPALASTRPEIVSWLPTTGLCVREQGEIAGWLETTDRIKFAGHMPLLADIRALLETAREIVDRTEKLFAPPPAEGDEGEDEPAASGGAS